MELGATVCLPRRPLCLSCPVQPWCLTRGEHPVTSRRPLVARSLAYGLAERESGGGVEVLLTQRSPAESLMPGMWELPPALLPGNAKPILTLRHAITVSNYTVSIYRYNEGEARSLPGHWTQLTDLPGLPLTGLARKVLKRLQLWPG